jgi:TonB family protein
MISLSRAAVVAAFALSAFSARDAGAQQQRERCTVVADTIVGPSEGQIRERQQLREQIASVFASHGAEPRGLLFVNIDSTRVGVVRFLDVDLADSTIQAGTAVVREYLRSLEHGRAYQALIRVDGEYPAVLPGRTRCTPVLESVQTMLDGVSAVSMRHPMAGKVREPVIRRAELLLVVNREGGVSWIEVVQPTGDEFLDQYVTEIAAALRFLPASLDGTAIDARTRFRLTFTIQ